MNSDTLKEISFFYSLSSLLSHHILKYNTKNINTILTIIAAAADDDDDEEQVSLVSVQTL